MIDVVEGPTVLRGVTGPPRGQHVQRGGAHHPIDRIQVFAHAFRLRQHLDQLADAVGAGAANRGVVVLQRGHQGRRVPGGDVLGQRRHRGAAHAGIRVGEVAIEVVHRGLLERQDLGDAR